MSSTHLSVSVSGNFKAMTLKAILSIIMFIAVYIGLFVLAIAFTIIFGYVGFLIISVHAGFITIMLGVGLASVGFLILIFLLKFLFKKHKVDRSHLIEIKRNDEPKLFAMIDEIAKEVGTTSPKKIYLSPEVNAAVFYDSSFWSMFFPIKKNLQIGVGLINTLSTEELRAVLSHEFGHFSQRTMKVGSYVHNVNQIIYNMLYDNESFERLAQSWSEVSAYVTIFVSLALWVTQGIQKILRKVYETVNINYMGLSREMEFHADEIAANVTGSKPLITSLLRMELADSSYNSVIDFYNNKVTQSQKTQNIYPQQQFVLGFLGKENELPFENQLPQVSIDHSSRFNKSKLNIKNQWASHPSTEDRVKALTKLNIVKNKNDDSPSTSLFVNKEQLESMVTNQLFAGVVYADEVKNIEHDEFVKEFVEYYKKNTFGSLFKGFYNNTNPSPVHRKEMENLNLNPVSDTDELFGSEALDWVYTSVALESDIQTLKFISTNENYLKTFDYDGKKYTQAEAESLIPVLEAELEILKVKIQTHHVLIFMYFETLAKKKGCELELQRTYDAYVDFDLKYEELFSVYQKMAADSDFVQYTNTFDIIESKLAELQLSEVPFKESIKEILLNPVFAQELTPEIRETFENYIKTDLIYFTRPDYDNQSLSKMFDSINYYFAVIRGTYFHTKKALLANYESVI